MLSGKALHFLIATRGGPNPGPGASLGAGRSAAAGDLLVLGLICSSLTLTIIVAEIAVVGIIFLAVVERLGRLSAARLALSLGLLLLVPGVPAPPSALALARSFRALLPNSSADWIDL